MKYGYARVSTLHQDLESQLQALEKENCDKIYSDKFTGTKTDRPHFNELLQVLKGVTSGKCGFTTLSKIEHRKIDSYTTFRNRFFNLA
jgi:predicted site-specific integrase-resolvase